VEPDTPLLYVLHNNLGLKGPKYGCGLEQCNACLVLIDGQDVLWWLLISSGSQKH
jgi:aerobic-type carbon monoxide dehydrogenase small subunit (CoxS/CutS family)